MEGEEAHEVSSFFGKTHLIEIKYRRDRAASNLNAAKISKQFTLLDIEIKALEEALEKVKKKSRDFSSKNEKEENRRSSKYEEGFG